MAATSADHLATLKAEYETNVLLLSNINTALVAIIDNKMQRYELDTGQTRRLVTYVDVPDLRNLYRQTLQIVQELADQLGIQPDATLVTRADF